MVVVGLAVAHEPVHGVLGRDGTKVLLGLGKLNFESRHFYIVFPLDESSPFSAVATGSAGSTTATCAAAVSSVFLVEFAILLIQVRNLLLELLYVSGSVRDVSQVRIVVPVALAFGAY
jgi:hypothetical protein